MAVAAKKLDVEVGDLVEIEGRRYDVVSNIAGGVRLEPAITKTVAELRAERGGRALTAEEFDELFGDLPRDGEG
jgi:anaerobic selenocysteine-containing dehydrogenase